MKNEFDEEASTKEAMNTEETSGFQWSLAEENLLTLARELEWAEAYAADYPRCVMGELYLDFLRWELVTAQAEI